MENLQTIQQVFTGRFFRIPDYQRGYAWEDKHVDDLLEDLELLEVGRQHYAGTLVLHEVDRAVRIMDQDGGSHAVYDIVDGQQRLTTIVMLLDCVRRALPQDRPPAAGIRKAYVTTADVDGFDQPRLSLNRDTREFFEKSVIADRAAVDGPQIRSHELLAKAHARMAAHIDRHRHRDGWLLELYRKITDGLRLTVYDVPGASDVGVIFEVMNNRGKPLSEMEKVKNYLLYVSSKMQPDLGQRIAKHINTTWSRIFEALMAASASSPNDEDQLLRAHWLMAYDYRPKSWEGSASIKAQFSVKRVREQPGPLSHEITAYLDTLLQFSVAYCDTVSPSRNDAFLEYRSAPEDRKALQRAAQKLSRLRVIASFLPLIGAARLAYAGDPERLKSLLRACERYAFRVYRFAEKRANAGQTSLFKLGYDLHARSLTVENAVSAIFASLEYYAPEREFRSALQEPGDWYGRSCIKYVLYEYEEHLAGRDPVQLPWDVFLRAEKKDSIEHIFPQTWTDPYWTGRWSQSDADAYLHDIGNLSLTFNNSSYGNKSFSDKKGKPGEGTCYANAGTFMERDLANRDAWTPAECAERRNQLVAWTAKRWGTDVPLAHKTIPPPEMEDDDQDSGG